MKKQRSYMDSVHLTGRLWTLAALTLFICVPVAVCARLDTWPAASVVLKGLASVAVLFYPTAVIEVIAYAPLLGAGGTYLAFVTGNITNLKMPCGLNALNKANVRGTSEEGECISTIAIATSSIVTTIIIAVGVLALSGPMAAVKQSAFAPAFEHVATALFGALFAGYIVKYWKIAILPIALISITLIFASNIGIGILIFIGVAVSMLGAHLMYKAGWVGKEKNKEALKADE